MDRILRPGGRVYIRDYLAIMDELVEIAKAMGWQTMVRETAEGPHASYRVLVCDKHLPRGWCNGFWSLQAASYNGEVITQHNSIGRWKCKCKYLIYFLICGGNDCYWFLISDSKSWFVYSYHLTQFICILQSLRPSIFFSQKKKRAKHILLYCSLMPTPNVVFLNGLSLNFDISLSFLAFFAFSCSFRCSCVFGHPPSVFYKCTPTHSQSFSHLTQLYPPCGEKSLLRSLIR